MKWFGRSWGAPINEGQHVETPVGRYCVKCLEQIEEGDRGIVVPYLMHPEIPPEDSPYHIQCWLEMILGPEIAEDIDIDEGEGSAA